VLSACRSLPVGIAVDDMKGSYEVSDDGDTRAFGNRGRRPRRWPRITRSSLPPIFRRQEGQHWAVERLDYKNKHSITAALFSIPD